jgi:putative heme transporter
MEDAPHRTEADADLTGGRGRIRRAWVRPVVALLLVVACGWLASRFLGAVDWAQVREALRRLTGWELLALAALLLVRQTLNAYPLALFIEGLSAARALLNDLVAALMATVAPPPGDIAMRLAMFRTWGIDASRGLAGATMNMLAFYANRFAAPLIGVLVLTFLGGGTDRVAVAIGSGAIAITIVVVVTLLVRRDRFADRLGRAAGIFVRRIRPSVDPEAWATAATDFQGHVSAGYRRAFPRALLALTVMVLSDACILLLALRFVGVGAADVPAYEVIGIFFLAYPLTLSPMMGLGIFDLVMLGSFMELGGAALEPELVAALTVWRAVTLLGPVLLGAVVTVGWRLHVSGRNTAAG